MPDDIKTEGETKYDAKSAKVTKFGGRGELADGKRREENHTNFYGKGEPTK